MPNYIFRINSKKISLLYKKKKAHKDLDYTKLNPKKK